MRHESYEDYFEKFPGRGNSNNQHRFRIPAFPRTPHLSWCPNATPDDIIATEKESYYVFQSDDVWITEKMDGSHCSFCLHDDSILIRNKKHMMHKGFVGENPSQQQFKSIFQYAYKNIERLENLNKLGSFSKNRPAVVYGEWLYMRHGIAYDALDDLFYAYDVLTGKDFLPSDEAVELLQESGFRVVPVLFRGKVSDVDFLMKLRDGESTFIASGDRRREGIYIKVADRRFKMVRPDFQPGLYFCAEVMKNELKGS